MSYTTIERNNAIIKIGEGNFELADTALYEDLEKFNWVHLSWAKNILTKVELTYSGQTLLDRLVKIK